MPIFKFPYTKIGSGYTFVLIPIFVKNRDLKKRLQYFAQIDSGAVFSVFHSDIATGLDINLDKIKEEIIFQGVGKDSKKLLGKLYILNLEIKQNKVSYKFDCPIIFSDDLDKNGYPLLGMGGFFENFKKITFDNETKKVVLES